MKNMSGFDLRIYNGDAEIDENGNVDVEVAVGGCRYAATFFALENIRSLFGKYKETGECAGGLYFRASEMIIVEKLNENVIEEIVLDLIKEDELKFAFLKLDDE